MVTGNMVTPHDTISLDLENRIQGLFRGAKLLILVLVTVLHCFL